jgi:ornithine cyclodeaminase/alanine dehydrogenase-like protein (mu-crystallin family)
MNQDTFKPFVQELVNAARPANEEATRKSQVAAALVVNSIGSMVTEKREVRKTTFTEAVDFMADKLKAAREAKLAQVRDNKEIDAEKPKAKTLAQLLVEAQDSE